MNKIDNNYIIIFDNNNLIKIFDNNIVDNI
jgi:hypothetical protein